MPTLDEAYAKELRDDIKNIKVQSYIQTIAVVLAFAGIVSIHQLFTKKK